MSQGNSHEINVSKAVESALPYLSEASETIDRLLQKMADGEVPNSDVVGPLQFIRNRVENAMNQIDLVAGGEETK